MKSWKKKLALARTVERKRSVVERHYKILAARGRQLKAGEMAILSADRQAELRVEYARSEATKTTMTKETPEPGWLNADAQIVKAKE